MVNYPIALEKMLWNSHHCLYQQGQEQPAGEYRGKELAISGRLLHVLMANINEDDSSLNENN
jgi:hypothetical protein